MHENNEQPDKILGYVKTYFANLWGRMLDWQNISEPEAAAHEEFNWKNVGRSSCLKFEVLCTAKLICNLSFYLKEPLTAWSIAYRALICLKSWRTYWLYLHKSATNDPNLLHISWDSFVNAHVRGTLKHQFGKLKHIAEKSWLSLTNFRKHHKKVISSACFILSLLRERPIILEQEAKIEECARGLLFLSLASVAEDSALAKEFAKRSKRDLEIAKNSKKFKWTQPFFSHAKIIFEKCENASTPIPPEKLNLRLKLFCSQVIFEDSENAICYLFS